MPIPATSIFCSTTIDLDKPYATFYHPPSDQTLFGKVLTFFVTNSVGLKRFTCFSLNIERFRSGLLHAVGEFKAIDTCFQIALFGASFLMILIKVFECIQQGSLLRKAFFPRDL